MRRTIVVITEFEREPWKKFIAGLENQETTTLSIDEDRNDNNVVVIDTATRNIGEFQLALKFQTTGSNNTVVLVRQQNTDKQNKEIISHIITAWLNEIEKIAICAHGSGGTLSDAKKDFTQVKIYKIFHHCDRVCEKLKVLFDNITNGDSFDKFWAFIAPKPGEVANLLRYEILSPLVALDLIMQAEENNKDTKFDKNLKDQVKKAISDLTLYDEKENKNPIDALCEKCIKCDGFREKLNDLVKGTNRDWSGYHSDLAYVAKKMEEQIAFNIKDC